MQNSLGVFSIFYFVAMWGSEVHHIDMINCSLQHHAFAYQFSFAPSLFISEYRRINLQKVKHAT